MPGMIVTADPNASHLAHRNNVESSGFIPLELQYGRMRLKTAILY